MNNTKEFTVEAAITIITGIHLGAEFYEESKELIEFISGEPVTTLTFVDGRRVAIMSKILVHQYPWLEALSSLIKDFCNSFRTTKSFDRDFGYLIQHLFKAYPCLLVVKKPEIFPSPSEASL